MNPIVRRELVELLRTRNAVAMQVSLALACAMLVLVRWPTGGVADLSGARSLEVLRLFGEGWSTEEVAQKLHLSPKTVDVHRGKIKEKMGLPTTPEFLRFAIRWVQSQR